MLSGPPSPAAPVEGDRLLRQARHDVHVAGWVLALEHAVDGAPLGLRGASESVLSPPLRSTSEGRRALGPAELSLPGGRTPHEFLRTDPTGARVQVERFETVRPDVTIELPGRDGAVSICWSSSTTACPPAGRRASSSATTTSWRAGRCTSTATSAASGRRPAVVFVCRDRARARECARQGRRGADRLSRIRRRVSRRLGVPGAGGDPVRR